MAPLPSSPGPTPPRSENGGIVGDAWQSTAGEVEEIGRPAFRACQSALEGVRSGHESSSLLVYGVPGSGKTHLIARFRTYIEQRNQHCWLDSLFVYLRLQASPSQFWRFVQRQFVRDLTRSIDGRPSQLERVLFRLLARPGSHGPLLDQWKTEIQSGQDHGGVAGLEDALARGLHAAVSYLRNGHALPANELVEHLDVPEGVSRSLETVLRHLLDQRHRGVAHAWLRGESLSEDDLQILRLPAEEDDEDPETRAREMVLQLLRLVGPRTPVALCFDQIEALRVHLSDEESYFVFGNAAATLRDSTDHVLLLSCIQTEHLARLHGLLGPNYDRIAEQRIELPGVSPHQARLLVEARGGAWHPARYAPLFERTGSATPRQVIQLLRTPAPESFDTLWEGYLERAAKEDTLPVSDQILEHGLPLLLRLSSHAPVERQASGDVQFVVPGSPSSLAVSICNQANATSLAGRLRRLTKLSAGTRFLLVRDERLPIAPKAARTQHYLKELAGRGAQVLRPSADALVALQALRAALSDAFAGDLSLNGETVSPASVEQWLAAHLPARLSELAKAVADPGPANDDLVLREQLLDLLHRRPVISVSNAARDLDATDSAILAHAASSSHFGVLTGPPTLLFRQVRQVNP